MVTEPFSFEVFFVFPFRSLHLVVGCLLSHCVRVSCSSEAWCVIHYRCVGSGLLEPRLVDVTIGLFSYF